MAHQIHWTKQLTEDFIDLAMLSDREAYIVRSRVKGEYVSQQAMHLNCCESTVHNIIKRLKEKYDVVQKENPDKFPVRIPSAKEDEMDNN